MKQPITALTLLAFLALGGQAAAEMCTLDAVPAATLLLPYFEIDLNAAQGQGVDTLLAISNSMSTPTLAHVIIWSDWGQPVLKFVVFLTGYDVQSISLYDVLVNGNLPVTADLQSDQGQDGGRWADLTSTCSPAADSCSPAGDPSWDASFPGFCVLGACVADCLDFFPFYVNPLLAAARVDTVQTKLTGQPIDGRCFGADYSPPGGPPGTTARGYGTVDNVRACSLLFPGDPGYFSDGVEDGLASNVNQLWGDWFRVDPANAFAEGDVLVHVEAQTEPELFEGCDNDYTFYRRYTTVAGGSDYREPLGATWGARYLNGWPFTGTSLTVWRDSTSADLRGDGFACGAPGEPATGPSWHPLNEIQVVAFNEQESWEVLCQGPCGPDCVFSPSPFAPALDPACFPLETQRVDTTAGDLLTTWPFGWMYLNLGVGCDNEIDDYDPSDGERLAQSYVQVNHGAAGKYTTGYPAVLFASAGKEEAEEPLFPDP